MNKKQLILTCLAVLCVMLGISYARRQKGINQEQPSVSAEKTETAQEKEEQTVESGGDTLEPQANFELPADGENAADPANGSSGNGEEGSDPEKEAGAGEVTPAEGEQSAEEKTAGEEAAEGQSEEDKTEGGKTVEEKTAEGQSAEEKTAEDRAAEGQSGEEKPAEEASPAKLLYQGHASIRITTAEGKVIYIDPFAGEGYEPAADLILITHGHYDHNNAELVENRNPDCQIITWAEALAGGTHQTFDLDYVTVEAVEAGYNQNHSKNECVGYVLTFSDGVKVYVTGDTSRTEQMPMLAEKEIDYAFYCCDGVYNMDPEEAAECAALVRAKHNIPYHVIPASGVFFDRVRAEQFQAENRLIIDAGEEIELVK
ncbi:MAG: MBL fold metallo-hydrolase [Eubacteriales bacterium]|nr:MBL fold metallo-hydrolase [Eubacteriales bacterium]